MSGFIKRYARNTLLSVVFLAASLCVAGIANPGHAAALGEIKGGKYYFEVSINGEPSKVIISKETTTVTLDPAAAGANTSGAVDTDGFIDIKNVPAGTYSVNINFKLTKGACADASFLKRIVGIFIGPITAVFCETKDDKIYVGSKVFGPIVVKDGEVTNLEADITSEKKLNSAIRTDENGTPQLDCKGGLFAEWVLCPVLEGLFGATDFAFSHIIKPFLAVDPLVATDSAGKTTPLYAIWDNLRNIVNIGLILVFFVIIFSQATSIGVSNYGVKRLLPRLIVVAIASNLSFYLCAILIDIFNILGAGSASLALSAVVNGQPTLNIPTVSLLDVPGLGDLQLALAGVPVVIPVIFIFIVIICLIFILVSVLLLIRQVILLFLIIVSPIALLSVILPNTSRFGSTWFRWLMRLLILYPMIMLLFAIGRIASVILLQV